MLDIIEAEEGGGKLLPPSPVSPRPVTTLDQLNEMVAFYMKVDAFAFDTETLPGEDVIVTNKDEDKAAKLDPYGNRVFWVSFATNGRADAIPMGHPNGRLIRRSRKVRILPPEHERRVLDSGKLSGARLTRIMPDEFAPPPQQLDPAVVWAALRPLFWSDKLKVGQNIKFDVKSVAKYYGGEIMPGPFAETSVLAHLLDERKPNYRLDSLAKDALGITDYPKLGRLGVENFSINAATRYAVQDATYTWLIHWSLTQLLEQESLENVWGLETALLPALLRMENAGALIDVKAVSHLIQDLRAKLEDIESQIYVYNGGRFINLNANEAKIAFLFGKKREGGRGLRPLTYTEKTHQPQVTQAVLEHYADRDPVARLMLERADVQKLLSTYAEPYERLMDSEGRVHADFVQFGARTGRLSCKSPNLQNVPRADTELGKKVRDLFIAPPGYQLVVADYDQVELRVIAHYSQDPTMVETFMTGADIHGATAELLLDIPRGSLKKGDPRRQLGKNINFATSFGAGPAKIAAMCSGSGFPVTVDEAKHFLNQFDLRFARVKQLKDEILATAKRRKPPYVKTILGRKRRLPELWWDDYKLRGGAERQAVNTVIQGSAADIMKLALIRLDKRLTDLGDDRCHLLITVHDELVTMVPDEMVDVVTPLVLDAMGGIKLRGEPILRVPLVVSCDHAQRWSEAK